MHSPSHVYSQSVDKQRIAIVGKSKARIAQLALFVLQQCQRKVDYSTTAIEKLGAGSILIIENDLPVTSLLLYQHHLLIFSALPPSEESDFDKLANATPKCGMIIYDESDAVAKEISKKGRADVIALPYAPLKPGAEKLPASLSSSEELKCAGAAFELVRKLGVSSEQFYRAIASFQ